MQFLYGGGRIVGGGEAGAIQADIAKTANTFNN